MESSFFHLLRRATFMKSTPGERYRADASSVRELAPLMREMDALSEISFRASWPSPTRRSLHLGAPEFVAEGFPAGYFCCGPRGRFLNRRLDTPW